MSNKLVYFLYVLTIGLLFAAFVGFGLAAFYKSPKMPEYPIELSKPRIAEDVPAPDAEVQKTYDRDYQAFNEKMVTYNLYASLILIGIAVIVLAVSILGLDRLEIIGDGLTLGGVFTLLHGLGRGLAVNDDVFRFVVVTAGLAIILLLAYVKFIRPKSSTSAANLKV